MPRHTAAAAHHAGTSLGRRFEIHAARAAMLQPGATFDRAAFEALGAELQALRAAAKAA